MFFSRKSCGYGTLEKGTDTTQKISFTFLRKTVGNPEKVSR